MKTKSAVVIILIGVTGCLGDNLHDESESQDGLVQDPTTGEDLQDCRLVNCGPLENCIICDDGEECDGETGLCLPLPICDEMTCGDIEVCDPDSGECVIDCRLVNCGPLENCIICDDGEECDGETGLCLPN